MSAQLTGEPPLPCCLSTMNFTLGASPAPLHTILSAVAAALPHDHGEVDPGGSSSPQPPPRRRNLHVEASTGLAKSLGSVRRAADQAHGHHGPHHLIFIMTSELTTPRRTRSTTWCCGFSQGCSTSSPAEQRIKRKQHPTVLAPSPELFWRRGSGGGKAGEGRAASGGGNGGRLSCS
jgi:hypothetical protein